MRKFKITASYETVPEDTSILNATADKELTIFACTNGLEGRRVVKARFIETYETLIPYSIKRAREDALIKIEKLPPLMRINIIERIILKTTPLLEKSKEFQDTNNVFDPPLNAQKIIKSFLTDEEIKSLAEEIISNV